MAATPAQITAFVSAFRNWSEQYRRLMDQATQLQALYTDLGLSTITNLDLTGENAGLQAGDVTTALTTAGGIITAWTPTARANFNKIGHGAP